MNLKPLKYSFLCILLTSLLLPINIKADTTEEIEPPEIAAESAIVMDASNKAVLYEKNAYEKQYPASITKLMTALLTIENLEPDDTITFSYDAIFGIDRESNHIALDVGEEITVDQALHALLLMSANEVACGLAEKISGSTEEFGRLMTKRAEELGSQHTNFTNPHGLHDPNHFTTAYDMALIGSYLTTNDYFLSIMQDFKYEIPPTNKKKVPTLLAQQHAMLSPYKDARIHRADVIGGKTGFTDEAGHTLVTMAKQGDTTLVVVILKGTKDFYNDTAKLLDYGFNAYKSIEIHSANDIIKTMPIYGVISGQVYQSGNCGLSVPESVSVTIPIDTSIDDISINYDIPNDFSSNLKLGDTVGEVTYVYKAKTVGKSPIVVSQINPVQSPKMHFYGRLSGSWFKYILICLALLILIFILYVIATHSINTRSRHRKNKFKNIDKLAKRSHH